MDAVHSCYVDEADTIAMNSFEMRQFRKDNFYRIFEKECVGKGACHFDFKFH